MASQTAKSNSSSGNGSAKPSRPRKSPASRQSSKSTPPRRSDGRFAAAGGRLDGLGISRNQAVGALAATAVGIGVGLILGWLRQRDADDASAPAAFAYDEMIDHDSFDQTRSAGPDAMRDDQDEWDSVDQASDESFPASDPPATY